jgi:hypothetical protein
MRTPDIITASSLVGLGRRQQRCRKSLGIYIGITDIARDIWQGESVSDELMFTYYELVSDVRVRNPSVKAGIPTNRFNP